MHYGHLVMDAIPTSEREVLLRLAFDCAARALHFDVDPRAHPEDARVLAELLAFGREELSSGAPSEEPLRARVDAMWDELEAYMERGNGGGATAIAWALSVWEALAEQLSEVTGMARIVATEREVSTQLHRCFPFFASDNEELWQARRLAALEEAFMGDALWSVTEEQLEPGTRLDFDPIALHDELLDKQRALPETERERLSVSLVALLDHGWAAQLGELLICVDGPPELAENIEHTIVVTDELRRPPFRVL